MSDEDDLFARLEEEMEVTLDEVVNVQLLTWVELLDLKGTLENELFDSRQALHPSDQVARDRHSLRNAVQVEIARRMREI